MGDYAGAKLVGDRLVAINKTGRIVIRYDENENLIWFDDEIELD